MGDKPADVDILIPTSGRLSALAITLSSVAAQTARPRRVIIADQSPTSVRGDALVSAAVRILGAQGTKVQVMRNLPRRGVAQQRAFLLDQSRAGTVLFLDDDVWLEPLAVAVLSNALKTLGCGFVGFAIQGLSYVDDHRPAEERPYEEWDGAVHPERVRRGTPAWDRHILHNAANLIHLAERLPVPERGWRAYKIAWIGGCVLYDRMSLVDAGGFDFWRRVPVVHAGEDVVAQLHVMERYGGAGLLPSRAYHLELPTTVPHRDADCYDYVIAPESSAPTSPNGPRLAG